MAEKNYNLAEIDGEAESWSTLANTTPRRTIETSDGRTLEHFANYYPAADVPEYAFGMLRTRANNAHNMYLYLAKCGVVELPEVDTNDSSDEPIRTDYAVYVDSRIGKDKLFRLVNMVGWSNEPELSLTRLDTEVVPQEELAAALDRGITETGIGVIVEQLHEQEIANVIDELDGQRIVHAVHDQLH